MSATSFPAAVPTRSVRRRSIPVPSQATGVELLGVMRGSGYQRPPSLVRRADGQTLQLTPLLYATLRAIDGRRDLHEIAQHVGAWFGRRLTDEDVAFLIEHKLRPMGLVRGRDGSEPVTRPANPLLALRLRAVVSDPNLTRAITRPFAALFDPFAVLLVLAAFGYATWATLFGGHLGAAIDHAFHDPVATLAVIALTILSVGFHEFGHAAACSYGGAQPGAMGVGLYLVWPAFYTDVSDSYRLSRVGRLRVDLGGLYFNAVFSAVVYAVWFATRYDALLLLILTQIVQMVRHLIPVVRFDGYHVLADLTGVPDLFHHVGPTLKRLVTRKADRPTSPLRPWARRVVTAWVLAVVPILALVLGAGVLGLPRIAATAFAGAGQRWNDVTSAVAAGNAAEAAVGAVGVFTLLLPVAGIVYLAGRLAVRGARWAWARAGEDPRRRAGLLAAGVTLLAAVAFAWWPQGQYEPVDPSRDATVGDVLAAQRVLPGNGPRVGLRDEERALLAAADERNEAVEQVSTTSPSTGVSEVKPAKVERPAKEPKPEPTPDAAPVVAPAPADPWPFPWDRPAPPTAGDNRAYVVNTTDGAAMHDVRIAAAWVTGGAAATQRNEAWALASCVDCRTLAVAFQAIFIVGNSDEIVPQNLSRAANVECERCVTRAIADQLVLSLTAMPDGRTRGQIQAVLGRLRQLRGQAPSMSPGEIAAVLAGARHELRSIVSEAGLIAEEQQGSETEPSGDQPPSDGAATTATTAEASPSPSPSPSSSSSPSPSPSSSPSSSPSPSPSPSASASSSADPTPEPSPSPSPSAEPSPTEEPAPEPSPEPTSEPSPEPASEPSTEPSPSDGPSPEPTSTTAEEDVATEPEPSPEPAPTSSETAAAA